MNITKKYRKQVKAAFKGVDREKLREGLDISPGSVRQIVNAQCVVGGMRALAIHKIAGISPSILRPDLFGKTEEVG